MKIGASISKIRKEEKMTQEEFAKLFHVTRQTVSNWENEKSYPDLETLVTISDSFNISLDQLIKGDKEMIEDLNKKIKHTELLKKIVKPLCFIIVIALTAYIIMYINWRNTEKELISYFNKGVQEQGFTKPAKVSPYYLKENGITYTVPNFTELNLFDYTMDGSIDAKINDTPNYIDISITMLSNELILLSIGDTKSVMTDKNGEIIEGSFPDETQKIYEEYKDQITVMIKKSVDMYDKIYKN